MSRSQPIEHKVPTLPKRASLGRSGVPIRIRTNYYEVDQRPRGPFYHYDCKIVDKKPLEGKAGSSSGSSKTETNIPVAKSRRILEQFALTVLQNKVRVAYDGVANLYSYVKLDQDKMIAEVTLNSPGGRPDRYDIRLALVKTIPLDSLYALLQGTPPTTADQVGLIYTATTVLDILLNQWPAQLYTGVGKKSFYYPMDAVPMQGGLEAWKGAFQSIRLGGVGPDMRPTGRLLVNVDTSTVVFRTAGNLVPLMASFLHKRGPDDFLGNSLKLQEWDIKDLNREFRGVEFEINHRGEHRTRYKIDHFTNVTAERCMFEDDNSKKKVSVLQHFAATYNNFNLRFGKSLPCVVVKKKHELYFPVEVCDVVAGQRYKYKLSPFSTAEFIKIACTKPGDRERKIKELTRHIGFENNEDLKAWGLHVNTSQLLTIPARILQGPILNYGSKDPKGTTSVTPPDGAWNLVGQIVPRAVPLATWAVVVLANEREIPSPMVSNFLQQLITVCAQRGMNVVNKAPQIVRGSGRFDDLELSLEKAYSFAGHRNEAGILIPPQLLMIVLPGKPKQCRLYDPCKKWGDCKKGVVTQCVTYNPRNINDQYCNNLFLKINAKLGGVNVKLAPKTLGRWSEKPGIIIGCDVTHAPIGSTSPSVAVLVASIDGTYTRYVAEIRAQENRKELIEGFGGMLRSLIERFRQANPTTRPDRILVYRDGVSEGMFENVKRAEIDAITQTCVSMHSNWRPTVTYVAVQKRHHTRFFPTDRNSDRSGNCLPGTVVDTTITHSYQNDFFLLSHKGIQGTSRPTHYQVLYDDFGFQPDELQLLTYRLCYTYGRCTRAVSVVPPVFYADQCGYRVRTHLKDSNKWSGDGSKRTSDDGADPATFFESVSQNLYQSMWWM